MSKSRNSATATDRARPIDRQKAHEIQAFGHLTRLPIALSEKTAAQSVENLNQVLADTITLRDLYKKHHWQLAGPTFYRSTFSSTSTTQSRTISWIRSPSGSRCSAASPWPWRPTWPRRR